MAGFGKTTVGRTVLKLVEPTAGTVFFEEQDVAQSAQPAIGLPLSLALPGCADGRVFGQGPRIQGNQARPLGGLSFCMTVFAGNVFLLYNSTNIFSIESGIQQ